MLGLALDTSYLLASVAIVKNAKVLYFDLNDNKNEQAESLNLMIEKANATTKISFKDYNYIAITTGPGRFTGMRVGITAANALGFILKIPLLPVSNFDIIAFSLNIKKLGIVLEAGIDKFYFQEFNNKKSISEITIITLDELHKIKKRIYLAGNIDEVHTKFIINAENVAKFANHKLNYTTNNLTNFMSNYVKPQYIINNYK
ncbi:tRNA (adenosine(37)-N6)-threonylcarbamoyltransferase complex dimerization subunit type 1 TsaB [Rickettsiales endosymbiont of Trichoplax sp. H2]|uniref:tRNA (adenosine(37)-N6)-threonylcarbamoyltransferase complex dimerization subunit type 1 TsaB n=1 Tax=Rickettsiales endosymbiont of Trichoplax sp. H2 TaxID=2021221 RepID=UPI0012B3D6AD|nr:tRNA (adenosine(37)-N6)-threonylcarbamoyltransferase complex dimerization subunit type 1 TsaB [Rickettsiales endosymbiont of Trichoplax sp. H2]MSO14189.1 tRNA threonylcarbamoyladenosine biosynthesis protein TsaB [Rickettsiales endosymbiont of Trichoplax sp. H2]